MPLKGSPFLFITSTVKLFLTAPYVVAWWPSSGTGSVLTVVLLGLGAVERLGDLAASAYKIVPCTELGDVDKAPSVPRGDWFFLSGFFFSGSTGLFATLYNDIVLAGTSRGRRSYGCHRPVASMKTTMTRVCTAGTGIGGSASAKTTMTKQLSCMHGAGADDDVLFWNTGMFFLFF